DGGDAEDDKETDVDVGDLENMEVAGASDAGVAKGDDADRDECAAQPDDWRQEIQGAVYGSRDNVFFEERFCAVHQRLEQAEWADPAGSPAILDSTDELALK